MEECPPLPQRCFSPASPEQTTDRSIERIGLTNRHMPTPRNASASSSGLSPRSAVARARRRGLPSDWKVGRSSGQARGRRGGDAQAKAVMRCRGWTSPRRRGHGVRSRPRPLDGRACAAIRAGGRAASARAAASGGCRLRFAKSHHPTSCPAQSTPVLRSELVDPHSGPSDHLSPDRRGRGSPAAPLGALPTPATRGEVVCAANRSGGSPRRVDHSLFPCHLASRRACQRARRFA